MSTLAEFTLHLKSTIDKHGVDLATALGVPNFVDLDNASRAAEILQSDQDAIVWQLESVDEAPIDPLYTVVFSIGAKTSIDPGRYSQMQFVGAVKEVFPIGATLEIRDYERTDGAPTTKKGTMTVIQSGIDSQVYDKESGYRFVGVVAKAVRD